MWSFCWWGPCRGEFDRKRLVSGWGQGGKETWEGIAYVRYVNQLEDDDFDKKETKNMLKMLSRFFVPGHLLQADMQDQTYAWSPRFVCSLANTNAQLKLAIDHALLPSASAPHLLSSYLQVLIMSEGDIFLHRTINDLTLLLRDPQSKPVEAAEKTVRSFCTKELRGVQGGVGDVEEYIANATLDLCIMSAWSLAASQVDMERLPVCRTDMQREWLIIDVYVCTGYTNMDSVQRGV